MILNLLSHWNYLSEYSLISFISITQISIFRYSGPVYILLDLHPSISLLFIYIFGAIISGVAFLNVISKCNHQCWYIEKQVTHIVSNIFQSWYPYQFQEFCTYCDISRQTMNKDNFISSISICMFYLFSYLHALAATFSKVRPCWPCYLSLGESSEPLIIKYDIRCSFYLVCYFSK